jgi:hypothetical protein
VRGAEFPAAVEAEVVVAALGAAGLAGAAHVGDAGGTAVAQVPEPLRVLPLHLPVAVNRPIHQHLPQHPSACGINARCTIALCRIVVSQSRQMKSCGVIPTA